MHPNIISVFGRFGNNFRYCLSTLQLDSVNSKLHLQTLHEAFSPIILYRHTGDIFEQIYFVIHGMCITLTK